MKDETQGKVANVELTVFGTGLKSRIKDLIL